MHWYLASSYSDIASEMRERRRNLTKQSAIITRRKFQMANSLEDVFSDLISQDSGLKDYISNN